MNNPLKVLPLACLFLCWTGISQPLAAQDTTVTIPLVAFPIQLPKGAEIRVSPPAVLQTDAPNRLYVGKVTKTSLSGKTLAGDIEMSVTPEGQVRANVTINGHVHPYYGAIVAANHGPKDTVQTSKGRSGVVYTSATVVHPGTPVVGIFQGLSLTVTESKAYGGTVNTQKSNLSFEASRIGLKNNGSSITLPIGVTTPVTQPVPITGG